MHVAAKKGRKEIVRLLLAGGADVNALSYQGETPLQVASVEEIKALIREAQVSDVRNEHSYKYEQRHNSALQIAFQHLSSRFPNLHWARSLQPYTELRHECQKLMSNLDFARYVTEYLQNYPDVERSLVGYANSVSRQQLLSWTDLPTNLNDPTWHGFFVERWRPAFLLLDSPAKYFINRSEGPLYWQNLPTNSPNLESATWLLRQNDFWKLRHGFAHTNYGWKQEHGESIIAAYNEETGETTVEMKIVEAEAFTVIVSAVVSVLLETVIQKSSVGS